MTGWLGFLHRLGADRRGATAVEFAFILPVLVMLLFGVISSSQLGGALSGMHYAVEEAARCSAVNKVACGTATATQAFAADKYNGPGPTPQFASSAVGCGHTVTATMTFTLELALTRLNVPLSATACYPGVDT